MAENQIIPDLHVHFYSRMVLIRKFEEKIVTLSQEAGRLPGMQILANGQEAVATGIVSALEPEDVIVSNHRSHGHLIARGADLNSLMAEIMAKGTGVNGGKAGTLHLSVPDLNILMTSTVVGAGPPLALGAAFAQQYKGTRGITVVFFGDGAANTGSFHESLNMAAAWKLPVIFINENNRYAMFTPMQWTTPIVDIADRAAAYSMPGITVDGNDVLAVYEAAAQARERALQGEGPTLLECKTYRLLGHYVGDPQDYRTAEEVELERNNDPLLRFEQYLTSINAMDEDLFSIVTEQK